ncbi:hypothetical protein [Trichloromonas sp.]|uniref:hypothetical protein n=1 Tax=Trichloromonas sp. TaxID=3069249 RepID=UPI003D81B90E
MTDPSQSPGSLSIACQQVLQQDASVFSIQWMDLPSQLATGLTPELLLQKYLDHIRRFTGTLVRPVQLGRAVEFRFWHSRKCLLRFDASEADGTSLALRIDGGLLVQQAFCRQGELVFSCEPKDGLVRVGLQLSDYCPLLLGSRTPSLVHKWFYRLTQAAIHKVVTVRFLTRLYRERAGQDACCRVVRVRVREGDPL